jgi:hypothetical protein
MAEAPPITPEAAAPQPAPTPGADLDSLLGEFDAAIANAGVEARPAAQLGQQPEATTASPQAEQGGENAAPDLDALLNDAASAYQQASVTQPPDVAAELRGKLEPLAHAVAAVRAQQEAAQNKADFENVVKIGNETVAGFDHLPAGFAETWLRAESTRDPELRASFDNRYSSPQAKHWAESRFKKAMSRLFEAAKSFPDKDATEDRAAVVAWMTRGVGKAPEPAPPKYGQMNDAEFEAEKKRVGL